MSATTLKLPYTRFVAQVSTAPARSKSTYLALMEENLTALQEFPWHAAAEVPVSLTDHDFTASTYLSDAYDAYKMTGNYDASAMTEIAYAGMVAYRFKIPDSARVSGSEVPITSVSLPISRDRYLKGGVRVAVLASNVTAPHTSWNAVRGDSGGAVVATVRAALAQSAANLLAGTAAADTLEIDLSALPENKQKSTYLWVYISLEDYTDHWDMYSAKEQRLYAIEGSAMLVAGSAEFTFADTVTADAASFPTRLFTTDWPSGNIRWDTNARPDSTRKCARAFALGTSGNNDLPLCMTAFSGASLAFVGVKNSSTVVDFTIDTAAWTSEWYESHYELLKLLGTGNGITDAVVLGHELYLSTLDGLYHAGTLKSANNTDYTNLDMTNARGKIGGEPGGQLILAFRAGSISWTDAGNSRTDVLWDVHCASFGDGVLTLGNSRPLPYDGEVTGIAHCDLASSGKFVVAGDLKSVGGRTCMTYGVVSALTTTGQMAFRPGDGQNVLVPNVFDNFRVVKAGDFYALGDFTKLGGVSLPKGVAKLSESGGVYSTSEVGTYNGSATVNEYIVDIGAGSNSGGVFPIFITASREETPL